MDREDRLTPHERIEFDSARAPYKKDGYWVTTRVCCRTDSRKRMKKVAALLLSAKAWQGIPITYRGIKDKNKYRPDGTKRGFW